MIRFFLLLFFPGFVLAAQCVQVDSAGNIVSAGAVPATQCPGFLVLDPTEFQGVTFWQQFFTIPASDELTKAFLAGFSAPFGAFVVSFLLGCLVKVFDN